MSLPVTVPFTFGNATTTQSLSSLDTNFTTITNSVNGLTNGASQINVASISATGTANSTTYLRGDGVWGTPAGGGGGGNGTVTSINVNGGSTGLTTSGGPVTTSGNITIAGTLVVANGGTGATSIATNNVILGNGTNAVQVVAPGTSGNALVSNGTTWVSGTVTASVPNTLGAVGTYGLMNWYGSGSVSPGGTTAGSLLQYSNISSTSSGGVQSGTWKAFGYISSGGDVTLFLRIV